MAEVKKGSKQEHCEAGFTETRAYHVNDIGGRPKRTVTFGRVTDFAQSRHLSSGPATRQRAKPR